MYSDFLYLCFFRNCETVLKKNDPSFEFNNIKSDLSELNTCNVDDFMDKGKKPSICYTYVFSSDC